MILKVPLLLRTEMLSDFEVALVNYCDTTFEVCYSNYQMSYIMMDKRLFVSNNSIQ